MQNAYISKLMEIAENDKRVIHILADSGTGYDEVFKMNMPNQILNLGIAEENMLGVAAGISTTGKIPFVYTAGAFLAYRGFEFIRDDICFQNLNVKIVGMGSGLAWSSLGPTHHTTEDISVLRSLPNLVVLSPSTPMQVAKCVEYAYEYKGPVYIKIGMNKEKEYFNDDYTFDPDCFDIIKKGSKALVITSGSILDEAYVGCENLDVEIINICKIKPINEIAIINLVKKFTLLFVIEEHTINGGLFSIVSEIIAKNNLNAKVVPIGIKGCFAKGYGNYITVKEINELDSKHIEKRIIVELANE